ncbi:MAG: aminoacyl-tRNA hydrolase [Candidatus Aminicenantia bacterium]
MWAIIGLGNPGKRYLETRHNVGFMLIDKLAKEWRIKLRKRSYLSKTGRVKRKDQEILLIKPQTYMNLSGKAVRKLMNHQNFDLENVIIIYDDLDIPLGEIRVKKGGGGGSHKGMLSIIEELKTNNFPRVRIGIGTQLKIDNPIEYVLSPFERKEIPLLEKSLEKAKEAICLILEGKIEKAMNVYNIKKRRMTPCFSLN